MLRDGNQHYFEQVPSLQDTDLQIGDFALVHETKIVKSYGTKLNVRERRPYRVTEIALSIGTYQISEHTGAELGGRTDGSQVKKFCPHKDGVYGTGGIGTFNTIREEALEGLDKLEEFDGEAVAGRKY